ncbi:MAG: transposase [Chitinispirillales bacterium]|jgi:transposase|nr:transposase [Chitinispirillales bacterium]
MISSLPAQSLIYVDETGVDECLYRDKCRSKRGVKVYGGISGRKYKRTNIVAAQCCDKIIGPMEYNWTTDHHVFETWFEKVLLRQLPQGKTIIMDNASFHRKKVLWELAGEAKCEIIFLPAYSPDLNPIEKTWANLKSFLRNYVLRFDNVQEDIKDFF